MNRYSLVWEREKLDFKVSISNPLECLLETLSGHITSALSSGLPVSVVSKSGIVEITDEWGNKHTFAIVKIA